MRVLEKLEPRSVFCFFEDLCRIPHGSGNTKAISDYCVRFAQERGLRCVQDAVNNIIIWKGGTPGYENAPTVILQGHLDMVAEKTPDSPIDFTKDPLDLQIDGDYVYAKGTTLGGDDGIAVAMALAILDSSEIAHPALEAVFTIDEEVGMDGAAFLDPAPLQGRRLLNIDSEDEGILTVSCAGGVRANMELPVQAAPCALACWRVTLAGLKGGHSGVEIQKERGNSNILMGRFLRRLWKAAPELRLVSVAGGQKDNAIPLSTTALFAVPEGTDVAAEAAAFEAALKNEFSVSDPDARLCAERCGNAESAMTEETTARVLDFLTLVPNGIYAMSMDIPGLVQTSCNLGVLEADEKGLRACSSIRSSVGSQKEMLYARMEALCARLGGSVRPTGDYPGWQYRRESALRETMVTAFRDLYGCEPKVEAIHAGLECGLFADKLPGLDAVSFGPDLLDIHTVHERMSIASVRRTWDYLCEILRRLDH